MANQQLVDYIKQQIQLGVLKEAIKNTLLQSGWPEADVKEALDVSFGQQSTVSQSGPVAVATDIVQPKVDPNAGRIENFAASKKAEPSSFQAKVASFNPTSADISSPKSVGASSPKSWKSFVIPGVVSLVVIALIVSNVMFYLAKQNAEGEAMNVGIEKSTLSTNNSGLTTQVSNLQSQLATSDADKADLSLHLSLLVPNNTGATTTIPVTISGALKLDDKGQFTLTTGRNLILSVGNSKAPNVVSVLKPLAGASSVKLTGSTIPGSKVIVISSVNDIPVPELVTTPTSTSSTVSAAPDPNKPIVP